MTSSPFALRAAHYIDRGYSVVPIAPGTKRPGSYSQAEGWKGMPSWERFNDRLPTELEINHWDHWPDAGLGLLCGKQSRIVALDRDYDTNGTDALEAIIPYSPVKKKGAKGYTAFFRYNGEPSRAWDINGMRVLDMLSDGRQTVMPGTLHPDGITYVYLTEDCLEDFDPDQLPLLPADFVAQVDRVLAPFQSDEDRKYQARRRYLDQPGVIDTNLSIRQQYFRDLNKAALNDLDAWVPKFISTAKPEGRDGYRCIATWRKCENANVGIHPKGIKDWGGDCGMTPIGLVMSAQGVPFAKAAEALRHCLKLDEPEHIVLTQVTAPITLAGVPASEVQTNPNIDDDNDFQNIPDFVLSPPGILGDIVRWIRATATKDQPELATAAAIALAATVMGRLYRSDQANWTSLYIIMVAKSGEGKEHPQQCVEKILTSANLGSLLAGSGYTSVGAIFSTLLKKPSHLAIIDEIGKLLKSSRAKGNSHAEEALDKLVEVFGRNEGVLRPKAYSDMSLPKGTQMPDRFVHNPAITILGATTPGTFFDNVPEDMIEGGFIGRLLLIESSLPRQLGRLVSKTPPPQMIVDWCTDVREHENPGNLANHVQSDMAADPMPLAFDDGAIRMLKEFEAEIMGLQQQHFIPGQDVILSRTKEKSMRLSMIACKAARPNDTYIRSVDVQWAIDYARHADLGLLKSIKRHRAGNAFESSIKKLVGYIRSANKYVNDKKFQKCLSAGAMPHTKLLKLMHMTSREFNVLIETAIESGVVGKSPGTEFGYAGDCYFALEDD